MSSATVTITTASSGSVRDRFVGLSYEKSALTSSLFDGSITNLIGLFKRLGPGVLRIGGNSVDQHTWNADGTGKTAKEIAPSDITRLAHFLAASGWVCIYGINLGGAAQGMTSPEMAADEVANVAQQLGPSLLGIEIGNECDNYGAPGNYFAGQWSFSDFLSIWGQFQSAIASRTPGIPLVGPASAGNVATWTVPFGNSIGKSKLSLTTQHYYRGDGLSSAATAATLLSPDPALASRLSTLQTAVQSSGIPYRMGECNSYYNGGAPGVSDSFAATLWSLDYMFTCAQAGASGVNFHGGGPYNSYSPIADNSQVPTSVRPEYYGLLFFAQAGSGALCKTTVSAGGVNVTAYTVQDTSGRLTLTVINKDPKQNLQLQIQLPRTAASASLASLTQTSTSTPTTSASIQGSTVAIDGTFEPSSASGLSAEGTTVDCYVPAFSAVQIQIT